MSNPIPESKLERIRALLAKAEATEYEGEAESFRNAAMSLMAKYGVEQAMLQHHGATTESLEKRVIEISGEYPKEKAYLLGRISKALGLYSYASTLVRGRQTLRTEVIVCGFPSETEQVELLYTSMLLQAAREMKKDLSDVWRVRGNQLKAFKRTWLLGFANKIYERLEEQRAKAVAETPTASDGTSTTLVLVDRQAMIKQWASKDVEISRPKKRVLSGGGWAYGDEAGERVDIGTEDNRLARRSAGAITS
ncbi:DUF2786 domain-containing protein [Microbispora sp. NPDC049633]|uniref:DUF2786 domain-containing protein n=1 Tax=Microbispora sp. NPDC049633 TaxID=3154355 RepID=UPI00341F023F